MTVRLVPGQSNRYQQTANGETTTYLLDLSGDLSQVLSDGTKVYYYGLERLAQQVNGGDYEYFLTDSLGSVRQAVGASAFPSFAQSFDPYGNVTAQVGYGETNYGFAGDISDPSGLLFLRARYYSPAQGRFITRDPFPGVISQPASLNAYVYALNNPVLYTDPSGEFVESPLDLAFILYDVGSIGWDIYRISQKNCYDDELGRQLWIDAGALAVDLIFLALPGATGGGMGLRFSLAGVNTTLDIIRAVEVAKTGARILQPVIKGVQVGTQTQTTVSYFKNDENNRIIGNRHGGFIESLKRMKDSSLRNTIRSLEKQIYEHFDKIVKNPLSRDIPHWKSEIKTFQEELDLAIQEAQRRGIK